LEASNKENDSKIKELVS